MSRKKGQGKNTFDEKPIPLLLRFAKGENAWAHFEIDLWRRIFKEAATAPPEDLKLFRKVPESKNPPLTFFAIKRTTRLLHILQHAIANNDGRPLRLLADAIETPPSDALAADPLRWWLLSRFFDLSKGKRVQNRTATMKEIRKELKAVLDLSHDDRHISRVCKELGIKLSGKPGRPKGS